MKTKSISLKRKYGSTDLYWELLKGRRTPKDFNVMGRICNVLDYMYRKYGKEEVINSYKNTKLVMPETGGYMPEKAIIIPTFQRPHALERALNNAHENTKTDHRIYFVIEPEGWGSYNEIKRLNASLIISKYPGNHTGAANTAYEETYEPFFIIANDDFNFHKDWDIPALKKFENPSVGAVGLNDGSGSGNYTPITLVRREYIKKYSGCMDIPNTLYYPGYNHNYVDTEFSATAKKRGMWAECPESVVEHMHWAFGKAQRDPTYEKSNATAPTDQITYNSRQHLWQ